MATMTPTINSYNAYNMTDNVSNSKSGWHTWSSTSVQGYASKWDAMAYKFTTKDFSGSYSYSINKIKVTLQFQKTGTGNFVFYILSYDPKDYSLDYIKTNNSAWGSAYYSSTASWQTKTFEADCTKTLASNTTYYLVVCGDATNIPKISAYGFGLSFNYTYINSISKPPKPDTLTNNHNNTFSASCSAVSNPGSNPVTTTIQYKLGSNGTWTDAGSRSISKKAHTAEAAADSQTVYVKVKADPTYGDTLYSDVASITLKNYVPPTIPTVAPSVSKNKTRFTIKEPWKVSWTDAGQTSTKVNNSSDIAGYRVVLQVKKPTESEFKSVPIKNDSGSIISKNPTSATWHTIDTIDLGENEIIIYPDEQGFEPGDKVRVGIRPYILWGAENPTHSKSNSNTNKLFNETENLYRYTDEITVQNAGVVRVKTGADKSSFKEGIVWVKINNTGTKTTDWVEADVVKVKTSSGWKESE
jgi:hypothetical protein